MVENLKRVREPAAWAMLAVIVGFMALNIVRLVWVLSHDQLPVFTAFSDIASNSMSLTLAALQVALVCLCLFVSPATGRSVALARASAVVVSLGTVLTVVATALGLWSNKGVMGVVFELLGGVLDILLKVLAAIILWIILRAVRTGRMQTPVAPATPEPELLHALSDAAPPVWQPAQAAGTVWKTAADAAAAGAIPPPTASTGEGYAAGGAWAANPPPRPGAAEALGWHRVTDTGPTSTLDAG